MKYTFHIILLLFLLCLPVRADADEISLTSDTMQYDIEAGNFFAEGNVTIKGRDMVITATHGNGHINSSTFNLAGNVTIKGTWNGDDVNLAAVSVTAEIIETPIYTLESGVSGTFGKVAVDCEYLQMIGDDIFAENVHKFQNRENGTTLSAARMKGKMKEGVLTQSEAEGNVVINGAQGKDGRPVEIKGKKAIYSVDRGTIVVSGGVSAVQNRRTLNADSLVFYPATNMIQAVGNPHMTVNIEDENLKLPSENTEK